MISGAQPPRDVFFPALEDFGAGEDAFAGTLDSVVGVIDNRARQRGRSLFQWVRVGSEKHHNRHQQCLCPMKFSSIYSALLALKCSEYGLLRLVANGEITSRIDVTQVKIAWRHTAMESSVQWNGERLWCQSEKSKYLKKYLKKKKITWTYFMVLILNCNFFSIAK